MTLLHSLSFHESFVTSLSFTYSVTLLKTSKLIIVHRSVKVVCNARLQTGSSLSSSCIFSTKIQQHRFVPDCCHSISLPHICLHLKMVQNVLPKQILNACHIPRRWNILRGCANQATCVQSLVRPLPTSLRDFFGAFLTTGSMWQADIGP